MGDELFPVEAMTMESPRLSWITRNDVHTYCTPENAGCPEPWSAWVGELREAIEAGGDNPEAGGYATGKTEDDAIVALARGRRIPLWNEESFSDRGAA